MPYIAKEHKVSVEFFLNTKNWLQHTSEILQITLGEGWQKYGDQFVYIKLKSGYLSIVGIGGEWGASGRFQAGVTKAQKKLEAKKWYRVEISQTLVDGKVS